MNENTMLENTSEVMIEETVKNGKLVPALLLAGGVIAAGVMVKVAHKFIKQKKSKNAEPVDIIEVDSEEESEE